MGNKRIIQAAGILLIYLVIFNLAWKVITVQAQTATPQPGYTLNVHRSFGYSSGSQIRGAFSAEVTGPGKIRSVTFLIDGKSMGQATQAPFTINFNTNDYPTGSHDLTATIQTLDNQTFNTPALHFEFATADQESATMRNIVFPLLGGILALVIVIMGGQFLIFRNRPVSTLPLGTPRKYGLQGGTICPRCHRPFPLHWSALNVGIGTKFDHCDFCGRTGLFRLARLDDLRKAETDELQMAGPAGPVLADDEKGKLEKMLDDSRFTDDH